MTHAAPVEAPPAAASRNTARGPRAVVFAVAAIFAAAIGYGVARIPIQVSDSLGEILEAQASPSIAATVTQNFTPGNAYFRPLRRAQIKALFDAARGEYQLVYRGFHVLLLAALLWLFTRALRMQSREEAAAAIFALTVLTGLHTFVGFVREAFPINHFLEIAVLCVAALNLAQSRGGVLADLAAVAVFVAAVLTLESGVLVWVVLAAAWLAGMRGVSGRAVALVTLLLVAYFALRHQFLISAESMIGERASGFFLERLEPEQLQARFGDRPFGLYVYNIGASLLSVVFSEPRDGIFDAVRSWRNGDVYPRTYLALLSSAATTTVIGGWAVSRVRQRRPLDAADRIAIVAGAVWVANAVLSFAYTKDEIVSVAGVFYAFAAYVAARALVRELSRSSRRILVGVMSVALLVVGCAWATRSIGVHHVLRWQTFRVRNDWARVGDLEPGSPSAARAALIAQLQREALGVTGPNVELLPEWQNRWFGN